MAFNVYLTFFRRYKAPQLRKLEKVYLVLCYGLPFIPAFVYVFIHTEGKGKVYGSALVSLDQHHFCAPSAHLIN
jgi:hypothetical protein